MTKATKPMHKTTQLLFDAVTHKIGRRLSPAEMARALNVSDQVVTNWSARGLSAEGALLAQSVFQVDANYLLARISSPSVVQKPAPGDEIRVAAMDTKANYTVSKNDAGVRHIAHYDTGGAMGSGVILRDQPGVIREWAVTDEWLAKNVRHITSADNLVVVTGFGDSMRPIFQPGDPVMVDRGVRTVDHDGIYFFRVGDEGFVKRLQRIPGEGIVAISENKAYRDWTIKPGMDFEVFGRVVKAWCGYDY